MIAGLVAHLSDDEQQRRRAVAQITARPEFEPGEAQSTRLPLVMEARDPAHSHDLTDWLNELPGVLHVDVVFVDLEQGAEQLTEEISHE